MARMRTLKPDAFKSLSLAKVERGIRWTFAGLWTYCDDSGRARYELRLIKSELYPLDDAVDVGVVENDIHQLEKIGAVCRYRSGGDEYLHIPKFGEHQHPNRPVKSKLPPCERTDCGISTGFNTDEHLTESAVSTHGGLIPVVVGEGRVDVEEKDSCSPTASEISKAKIEEAFERFWAAFPKHVAKIAARRRFETLIKRGTDPEEIIDGAIRYASERRGQDAKFTKQPDGWLNTGRWEDEPDQTEAPHQSIARAMANPWGN